MGERWAKWLPVGLAIAVAWTGVLAFVAEHALSLYDDAYIYLRYVDHLLAGCGLRFNCSEAPVEGFTSPLWLALLTAFAPLATDLEVLTQVLGTLTLGAALTVAVLTGRAAGSPTVALCVALVLGLDHYVALNAVSGLETSLACLAVVLIAHSLLAADARGLRALVVVASLARPECVLFIAALPLLPFARSARYLLPVGGVVLAIVFARALLFGDVAPNTYWAKSGGTLAHAQLGVRYIGQAIYDFPLIALAPLALLRRERRAPVAYLLVVFGGWFAFFLRSGGDTFHYSRLAMPLVPVLSVLGLLGAFEAAWRFLPRPRISAPAACALLTVAATTRAVVAHDLEPTRGFPNVRRWEAVGRHLGREHPGETIATVPIGAIGYFSRLPLIDLVGLTSTEIARAGRTVPASLLTQGWIGHERHLTEYVLERAPDLIVMTRWQEQPWTLAETKAGFYAEWLLLQEIKQGRAPYAVHSAPVAPGMYWLMFRRVR